MSNFSFSATAECDLCGALLGSSTEECDHNGYTAKTHVFRWMNDGRDSLEGVEATRGYMWQKLKERVGSEWIAYQYLGPRELVDTYLDEGTHIEDIPRIAMSTDAPIDE